MSRVEFMKELTALLLDIPEDEKEEALQYYEDYFEDAGIENEESVIKELGTPEKVAKIIKAGLVEGNEESSEYRETGYTDVRFEENEHPMAWEDARKNTDTDSRNGNVENAYSYKGMDAEQKQEKKPWSNKVVKAILIVLLVVLGAPIVIPMALAGGCVVLVIVGMVVLLAVGILLSGVAITISGFLALVASVTQLFVSFPVAIGLAGGGFLMLAFGLALTIITWWVALKVIPPVIRWFVNLCSGIFRRKRK